MKKITNAILLLAFFGSTSWGQVVVNEGFESSCSNYSNSFFLGCIPNWFSASGTPDNKIFPTFGPAYQGSRYAHMYAKFDMGCAHPQLSEGIALNYAFQAGVSYKITYAMKAAPGTNPATQSLSTNWILTNGLINQGVMASCVPAEYTPVIPAGSQVLPNPTYSWNTWTSNTHTFTPTSNFNQLWFRAIVNSSVSNAIVNSVILIDDVKIEKICIPTPSIAGASTFCSGSPLTFTGSATNCTVTNNVWTVVECTATGGAVAGAVEWWSPWATGAPGTLTVPATGGPALACGKYYRIKLAVQNSYTPWAETTKIVYIACPPSFKLKGSTSTICSGDAASLNATLNPPTPATCNLTWTQVSPAGGVIYSGPMAGVSVSPSVTTTYQATVTDWTTGCSSAATWTVNVVNNDPKFSLNVNTTPANYFTLGLTANNLLGYSNPGFYYALIVEELNTTGSPYYQDNGTDCWWNYPSVETFQGYVSTGTGTFTQSPWGACPAPTGQFLYNHTYRITRGTWNDQCPYKQFSVTVSPVRSNDGHGVQVREDLDAPDYSAKATINKVAENKINTEVSIYPNPSKGIFTIETANNADATVEIYNLLGKKVKSMHQVGTKTTVDLNGFPKGMYVVKILSANGQITEKITIE